MIQYRFLTSKFLLRSFTDFMPPTTQQEYGFSLNRNKEHKNKVKIIKKQKKAETNQKNKNF